ncbi:MAG: Flagella basal body P-ring formation protein FlgA precursor [Pseudomonadota bacterium]
MPRHIRPLLTSLSLVLAASAQANTSDTQLVGEARLWLSQLQERPAEQIQFEPLDARVKVEGCSKWQFDLPFGEGHGLRARCTLPKQQVFLRLSQPARAPDRPPQPHTQTNLSAPEPQETLWVLAARENLASQQRLRPEVLERKSLPSAQLRGGAHLYLTSAAGLDAMQTTRALKAGEPIRLQDVRPALLVRKGDIVQLQYAQVPGLSISIRVEALEDGRMGQRIRLKNQQSGRFTMGEVVDQGLAMIR